MTSSAADAYKLLVVNPNTSVAATDLILRHVQQILQEGVQISAITAKTGSSTICSEVSYAAATGALVDTVREYLDQPNSEPPDAIIIGCFGDPGIFALREYLTERGLTIPAFGLAEASMRKAAKYPGKFVIITGGQAWGPILTRFAKELDLFDRLSRIITVAPNGAQLAADRSAAVELLRNSCKQAVLDDKCTCIILGGALLAGMAADFNESDIGVPLIDCVTAGVELVSEFRFQNHA
jgi:allantoin racemase